MPANPGDVVDVRCEPAPGGWTCRVVVGGPRAPTTHVVGVSTAALARLAPRADDPEDLVRRSFAFLLTRERKESILGSFDLPVIGRYFPEYEATIRRA
jgi:hypothetical protein